MKRIKVSFVIDMPDPPPEDDLSAGDRMKILLYGEDDELYSFVSFEMQEVKSGEDQKIIDLIVQLEAAFRELEHRLRRGHEPAVDLEPTMEAVIHGSWANVWWQLRKVGVPGSENRNLSEDRP